MSIKINLNIFLFAILFFFTSQFEIYALTMIFALMHELGHLVCGIILGFQVKCLNIMPLGFSVEFYTNIDDYNVKIKKSNLIVLKKLLIDFAGPFVNIFIIMISIIMGFSTNFVYANLIILIVNLIPIYPLDGGRILRNFFKLFFSTKKAYSYTNKISNIFFCVISIILSISVLYFKNIAIFFAFFFICILILCDNKRYNTYRKIYEKIELEDN